MNDKPAIFLYTGDLWKDISFRLCGWQAQNLWLRLLMLLHDNIPRGKFCSESGVPYTDEQLAALCNMPIADFRVLREELESNNVFSRVAGAIANRRMLREAELHENKVKAGKIGSKSRWQKYSRTVADRNGRSIATSPASSSSSSSSSSISDSDKIKTSLAPKTKAREAVSTETWNLYSEAYLARYKTLPVRNHQVNSQLKKLVELLGAEEAPHVAAFYLTCMQPIYLSARHPTNLLLRDATGLRTQWKTNTRATKSEIKTAETQASVNSQLQRILNPSNQQTIDVTPIKKELTHGTK